MTFDCAIARASDSAMAGELKSGVSPRRRSNSGSGGEIVRSVSERETMPGTVFLLTHFFYAYAVTTREPMKLELAYDDIRTINESSYSRTGVVLTTTRDMKFLIDRLQNRESFIQQFKDIAAQSVCSAVDEISNAAVSGGDLTPSGENHLSPRKANAPPQPRPCEPLLPATVPFKVYIYEHDTTFKAKAGSEPCPVSLFVGSKPNLTFKRVVEEAFQQAGLPQHSCHKYRIFTVMPGVRFRKFAELKLTSKWSIASCMAPANIIWHGAPVIMRLYNKSRKSGIKIPNPAALVASAASATAAALTGANTGPSDVTVSFYIPARGAEIPFPIPQDQLKSVKFPMVEPLNSTMPRLLKEAGIEYDPAKHEVFLTTMSAEPGADTPLLIPIDLAKKPLELFLVESDILVIKELPPFKGIADKFAECDSVSKTGFMLACEFAAEPLFPQSEPLDLAALAKALELPEDLAKQYREHGEANAKYGPISLLTELNDRLNHVEANPTYNKDTFENEKNYNDWCTDERESILALMRNVLFQRQQFCAELHVRVCGADDISGADIGGFSDPYCTVIYKTQVQSTKVCMQTLHPKWDEEFVFSVSSLDKAMTFNLYDWDALSAPDYLGTATLPFREQIAVLDGQKHTLTLPINKKGEITIEVQAYFEGARFLSASTPETPAPKTDFRAVYKCLYMALKEDKAVTPEAPWLLREFSARTGVSQIYCSIMKLDDLLKLEPSISVEYNKCLYNNAMKILRPMSVPNRDEIKVIVEHVGILYDFLRDKYMPMCFCDKDTARDVMETCVRLYVECCIAAKKTEEMAEILEKCVKTGVRGQCNLLTSTIAWKDEEKVGDDVRTLVCEQLLTFFNALHSMYENVMPSNIKDRIFNALVSVFAECVDECYGQLCDVLCNTSKSHQGAVYAIMQATTTLAKNIKDLTGVTMQIPAATALYNLWVRNNSPTLTNWVERAINVDKFVPLQQGLLHSSSVVDVSEACSQIITQMKELVVPDVFVWTQAGEVLLEAMELYFNLQKNRAKEIVKKHENNMFAESEEEGRPLQKVCIAIGNIEKGQELLDTIIASVEEGMEKWHKENPTEADNSRFDISSQALSQSVATRMKKGQNAIADPIRLLATVICNPLTGAVAAAMESEAGLTEEMISKVTSKYDDAIGAAHSLLSKRSFRMLLYSCWLISTDTISKAVPPNAECNGPKKGMNIPSIRDSIDNALTLLYDYFNPEEGEGLTQSQLDGSRGYTESRRLVCLYRQNTESLIAITRGFAAKPRRLPDAVDPLLKGTTQMEVETLIKTRIEEGDLWARAYAKEMGGSDDSQGVRDHFSLPPSELLLNKWVCSVGRKAGTLYLMSRHLCFDTAFSKAMNDTTSVVIMLEDITSIEEVSLMLLFKGIKITADHVAEDEIPVFSKFVAKVQDVMTAIRCQALLINNTHLSADGESKDKKDKDEKEKDKDEKGKEEEKKDEER